MVVFDPISTLGQMMAPPPIQTLSPIFHGTGKFRAFDSFNCFQWMVGGIDLNQWPQKNILSDPDIIAVEENAIEIRKEIVSHFDMKSIIAEKWRLNINVSSTFPQ